MKKIVFVAAAASLVSAPAFAASTDSSDVVINASVQKECSIEDIGTISLGDISINEDPGESALQIVGTTKNDTLAWVSCNYTNQMKLETPSPLVSASAASLSPATGSASFTNQIQYRFAAANYHISPFASSLSNPTRTDSSAPIHKKIRFEASVRAEDNAGARPYAASDYTATATVSMTTL